jgi:two-component system cell cycle response regulator
MQNTELVLEWRSSLEWRSLLKNLEGSGYFFSEGSAPDIRVLDVTQFHNIKSAMAEYHENHIPTVLILEGPDQESSVLPQLRCDDDVCLSEQTDTQLSPRLLRVIVRSGRRNQDASSSPAFLDLLTGLQNRHAFLLHYYDVVREAGPDSPFSLLFIDIDGFKTVNDSFGHAAGDSVLSCIAGILRRICSGATGICRYGGDEFLVSIKTDRRQVTSMAEFILKEIAETIYLDGQADLVLTVSIGTATSYGDHSGEDLIREADRNVYSAKSQGRNRVVGSDDFITVAEKVGEDPQVVDFENRVRVLTEKLIEGLTFRGKSLAMHYKEEADHDGLTGLHIRRYFDRRLTREFELSKENGRPLALLFLDIDHFGDVNKTYGFPTGDKALRFVAGILKDSVRVVDWVARYGGEELCVVLPDTPLEKAVAVAERIRIRVEEGRVTAYDGRLVSLTASLGAGLMMNEDRDIVDFVQRVGDKTREAKESGRNLVRY